MGTLGSVAFLLSMCITASRGLELDPNINNLGASVAIPVDPIWSQMVQYVYASYCPFNTIVNWTCFWCHEEYAKLQGKLLQLNGFDDS